MATKSADRKKRVSKQKQKQNQKQSVNVSIITNRVSRAKQQPIQQPQQRSVSQIVPQYIPQYIPQSQPNRIQGQLNEINIENRLIKQQEKVENLIASLNRRLETPIGNRIINTAETMTDNLITNDTGVMTEPLTRPSVTDVGVMSETMIETPSPSQSNFISPELLPERTKETEIPQTPEPISLEQFLNDDDDAEKIKKSRRTVEITPNPALLNAPANETRSKTQPTFITKDTIPTIKKGKQKQKVFVGYPATSSSGDTEEIRQPTTAEYATTVFKSPVAGQTKQSIIDYFFAPKVTPNG